MLFALYVTFKYRNTEQYKNTRINVFFSTLASVAIIFVGFNIVLTSISFEYNQKFSRLTKTKEAVDKLWIFPNQLLQSSQHIRPEFAAAFYMANLELYNMILLPNKKSILNRQTILEEQFISNVMIQAWEDCLTIRKYDEAPLTFWLRSFISWAQNPYFKAYYNRLKFEYKDTTIQLATLLFEYAEKIPVPTEDINLYKITVDKMMKDPRYISLLKEVS
jgi:hypothetical protein